MKPEEVIGILQRRINHLEEIIADYESDPKHTGFINNDYSGVKKELLGMRMAKRYAMKQVPQIPIITKEKITICPVCRRRVKQKHSFCKRCGQAIKW